VVTGLGATESAPYALSTGIEAPHQAAWDCPVPGVELKLVPVDEKIEARTARTIDHSRLLAPPRINASGLLMKRITTGSATPIKFADPQDPLKGFVFDGR